MKLQKGVKVPIISYKGNSNIKVQVGYTDGDSYYSVRRPKHFFRIFQGFGLGIDVYNELINREIDLLFLYNDNKIYISHLHQWKHSSRWDNEIQETEKIDPQYILELSEMKIYETDILKIMKGGIEIMENQTDLENVGPIQSTGVDLSKYDKQVTTIEKAEITQLPSQFTPLIPNTQQHYMQWVLRISSVVLESIREGEDKIEFRATEVFNLTQNDTGKLIGFPTGEGAKLMKFLKDLKIPDPDKFKTLKELMESVKGKKTVIKAETKEKDGRTNTYLRFRY